jgi:hydrogenase maturation protein HypF
VPAWPIGTTGFGGKSRFFTIKRVQIQINGIVQGVGFRPFIYRLAARFGLSGRVWNGSAGVTVEAQGDGAALTAFVAAIRADAPPLALISSLESREIPVSGEAGFAIVESRSGSGSTMVSPDCDVCPDCLAELFNPADRRYRYPFINCTNCGPRYSIITRNPYDRPNTTMAGFPLCDACRHEYENPADRRFHAQPVACPACGPWLQLLDEGGSVLPCEPLAGAVSALQEGRIVAVKGIGGYHLAVDPCNPRAVEELRLRKKRDEKPFAIMVADLEKAGTFVCLNETERRFLSGPERPIVLARKSPGNPAAPAVAPANDWFGIMLPSSPLHYLLLEKFPALVMTSANLSDEPVIYRDHDALRHLAGIADRFLVNNREIHAPSDDSVIRVFRTHPILMRRSRGYVPRAIALPEIRCSVLALGGELKAAACLASGTDAYMSRHVGDLKGDATLAALEATVAGLEELTGITPQIVAHDLHPDYRSTLLATKLPGLTRIAVQHHHAHLAACMAENRLEGEVIGVIFDGAGYGPDGTVWGGEFLVGGYGRFSRAGHLRTMRLPGGDAAAREPYRMAIALLYELYGNELFNHPFSCLQGVGEGERRLFLRMLERGLNSPVTSSCGRLFDGVAALLGVRQTMSYEGQAAIELEGLAERGAPGGPYPMPVAAGDGALWLDWGPLVTALLADLLAGRTVADSAATFHLSLAVGTAALCRQIRMQSGLDRVVLSGGVFQNRLLSEEVVSLLAADGFQVFCHRLVPPGDGGLALGQAIIAGRSQTCV